MSSQRKSTRPLSPRRAILAKVLSFLLVIVSLACGGAVSTANPLGVTVSPESITLLPGQSYTFQVMASAIGEHISLDFDPGTLSCTPDSVVQISPFVQDVVVTVPEGTTPGDGYRLVVRQTGLPNSNLASASIVVGNPSTEPTFSFTASPNLVTGVAHAYTAPTTFTLSSLNGFSGTVSINWSSAEGIAPNEPTPRPLEVNLTPGTPVTFTRTFYRYAEHHDDIPITFTATSGTTEKSVTVTTRETP